MGGRRVGAARRCASSAHHRLLASTEHAAAPRARRRAWASAVKPIKVSIGDLLEVDGRLYDVVPDKQGGATLESAITMTVDEILAKHGGRRLTAEEFEEQFGDLPSDEEG